MGSNSGDGRVLVLFDVDGTLTLPRRVIAQDMAQTLTRLNQSVAVGLVGGSDLAKIAQQMDCDTTQIKTMFDYVFSENGLVSFQKDPLEAQGFKEISNSSMLEAIGEPKMQEILNFSLKYLSGITLPCKRGNFIEFRRGMLNISPVGRSCSQEERDQFFAYDQQHGIRRDMVAALEQTFGPDGIKFSIGGQISIDVFPVGWDKTYCLQFVEGAFSKMYFMGDKTMPGGNDYEIFSDPRVEGQAVTSPDDTVKNINAILDNL